MADEIFQPDRLTLTEEASRLAPPPPRPPRRGKPVREARSDETISSAAPYDRSAPRGYSLMRTRRLLMAALRVWELKNGIHSSY
jgi:hypothetical protein